MRGVCRDLMEGKFGCFRFGRLAVGLLLSSRLFLLLFSFSKYGVSIGGWMLRRAYWLAVDVLLFFSLVEKLRRQLLLRLS